MQSQSLLRALSGLALVIGLMVPCTLAQTEENTMKWQNAPDFWKQSGASLIE